MGVTGKSSNGRSALRTRAEEHLLFYGREFSEPVIVKAQGAHIYDESGRAIIDFSSGQMCATVGHNHPAVAEAIRASCDDAIHLDSTKLSPAVIELAEELCALLPLPLQKAMFLSTGGESNEAALRLAKLHTGKFEVIALGNSGIASESHAPQMCRLISDGLRAHYGVRDEDQESWIVHIDGDEDHSETAFKVVLDYCTSSELQQMMFWCIDEYTRHWGNFWRECEKGLVKAPNLRRLHESRLAEARQSQAAA